MRNHIEQLISQRPDQTDACKITFYSIIVIIIGKLLRKYRKFRCKTYVLSCIYFKKGIFIKNIYSYTIFKDRKIK